MKGENTVFLLFLFAMVVLENCQASSLSCPDLKTNLIQSEICHTASHQFSFSTMQDKCPSETRKTIFVLNARISTETT